MFPLAGNVVEEGDGRSSTPNVPDMISWKARAQRSLSGDKIKPRGGGGGEWGGIPVVKVWRHPRSG